MDAPSRWLVAGIGVGLALSVACTGLEGHPAPKSPDARTQAVGTAPWQRLACTSPQPCTMPLLAAGRAHTVNVRADGTVWQTGTSGAGVSVRTPQQVASLVGASAVAAGETFSVALANGAVWTWGSGVDGKLGNGGTANSTVPVRVVGASNQTLGTNFVGVAAGRAHGVALTVTGEVWTWGKNNAGQLGLAPTTPSRPSAAKVPSMSAVAVAAGDSHTVALKSDGTVWAWGGGSQGQLGAGAAASSAVPTQVPGVTDVVAIAAGGSHTLALDDQGRVWAWGSNAANQTDPGGTSTQPTTPHLVGLTGIVAIAAGGSFSVALGANGRVWTWGANLRGQLGNGLAEAAHHGLVEVAGVSGAVAIAAGDQHTVAMLADGSFVGWGSDLDGQLGLGGALSMMAPTEVPGLTATSVAAGLGYSLAVTPDGVVMAWGDNEYGQLGTGTTTPSRTPTQVAGLSDVMTVVSYRRASFAVKSDGTLWAWGQNDDEVQPGSIGLLGTGSTEPKVLTPQRVQNVTDVVGVSCSQSHVLVLTNAGAVLAWGSNSNGQLGDGTASGFRLTPVQVASLPGVSEVVAGNNVSLARTSSGQVYSWGNGTSGGLGDGRVDAHNRLVPALISAPSGMGSVTALSGDGTLAAVDSSGQVWTWGYGFEWLIGNQGASTTGTPTHVIGLPQVRTISMSISHAMAVTQGDQLYAWGANAYGQLGIGSRSGYELPSLTLLPSGVIPVDVAIGYEHTVMRSSQLAVYAWGNSSMGQVGTGVSGVQLTPQTRAAGYLVNSCDVMPDCVAGACAGAQCNNHGTCQVSQCVCASGYAGATCQYSDAVTCNGHGTARADGGCTCAPGYSGATCDSQVPPICNGHGAMNGDDVCACDEGYAGDACEACAPGFEDYPTCSAVGGAGGGAGTGGAGTGGAGTGGAGTGGAGTGGAGTGGAGTGGAGTGGGADGSADAGQTVRRPEDFTAAGCSCGESAGLPLLGLGALVMRRRRRHRPGCVRCGRSRG